MGAHIDVEKRVAQLILDEPGLIPFFERLGIDYCCGGKKSLREACERKGLDAATVARTLEALSDADGVSPGEVEDWSRLSLTELCDHIEEAHHRYLRDELPQLGAVVDTVASVHGSAHPRLHQVNEVFRELSRELLSHMEKEEQNLFPRIRAMESDPSAAPAGSLAESIRSLESEHQSAGDALEKLNQLTDGYAVPADACGAYRAMLAGLERLEKDMHRHVHKENNILFPRALEQSAG